MTEFRDLSDATVRKIDRMLNGMAELSSLEELEMRFVTDAILMLPADLLAWNNWTLDGSGLISGTLNDNYQSRFDALMEAFEATVGKHPIIAAGQYSKSHTEVVRMSDFQNYGRFKQNPLFREVYRHLDSHFQLSYTPSILADRQILLTLNRRAFDFTEQDRQLLHYLGNRLDQVARLIEQRQQLETAWHGLCAFVDAVAPIDFKELKKPDLQLLADLLRRRSRTEIAQLRGIRRDTLDKRLGAIRESLGFENHHQLLVALTEMQSQKQKRPSHAEPDQSGVGPA
ncbi:MAG: hypothetical protein KGQ87_05730 [Verrucomicrobia bacterium]|nr:hypothetical protein [Verrucomicrobiota bacterium]